MSYVIPIGGFLLVICLASWQVGEWVSRLVPPVARDGNIIQISRLALARAEYITNIGAKLCILYLYLFVSVLIFFYLSSLYNGIY